MSKQVHTFSSRWWGPLFEPNTGTLPLIKCVIKYNTYTQGSAAIWNYLLPSAVSVWISTQFSVRVTPWSLAGGTENYPRFSMPYLTAKLCFVGSGRSKGLHSSTKVFWWNFLMNSNSSGFGQDKNFPMSAVCWHGSGKLANNNKQLFVDVLWTVPYAMLVGHTLLRFLSVVTPKYKMSSRWWCGMCLPSANWILGLQSQQLRILHGFEFPQCTVVSSFQIRCCCMERAKKWASHRFYRLSP